MIAKFNGEFEYFNAIEIDGFDIEVATGTAIAIAIVAVA